ncbi:MFS transporter [Usitatibacter palustris]|uniref:Multidrug resistance protein MdtG n=1 Tax=Usitatibacter palustris TaxID=2732487 RepID=A0A6M4HCK5_9PROT|nr:MFS transporter [Usitatibacter palustris]QJR16805.1 Multidrug resistance protein MdtG [Usitatibacter palustris]
MLDKNYLWRIYWQLAGVIMASVVVGLAVVSYFSHSAFQRELVPETEKKAITVGASVRALVLKATGAGIPFDSLYGVEQTFDEVLAESPEFAHIALTDASGRVLFTRGKEPPAAREYFSRPAVLAGLTSPGLPVPAVKLGALFVVSIPIVEAGKTPKGMLHIGIDSAFVDRVLLEVLLDIVVVLVVSLFFTLELLNFMAGARLASGLGEFTRQVERMKVGDFTPSGRIRVNDEIGRLLRWIDSAIDHLNVRFEFLLGDLNSKMKNAAPAAREKLAAAAAAMDSLHTRMRFGDGAAQQKTEETDLNRIRAPLFAFILAEELTRSYLPGYVNQLIVPIPGISPQVVIGLPIMLFMLIVALGQPYLGGWSERVGRRQAMLVGAILATIGFAATSLAYNLYDLLLWRSLCALGYGMVFVSAQGYVLDRTDGNNRAQGFALFIGAIMVATVCGPSIGGILADNIGFRLSFAVSAGMAFLSLLAIVRLPKEEERDVDVPTTRAPKLSEVVALIFNRRFMTLTGLAAMPAKILLTGVCFYLVPLYIVSIGNTQAMAGRMLMVYAIMMVLVVPFAATQSDASLRRERYVSLGLVISGLGGFLLLVSESFLVLFGVVFLLGLGQALSIAAQSALVGEHCQEEIRKYGADAVYGVYRLLERFGNVLGPLIASVLVILWGYQGAFVAISLFVFVCGLLFALLTRYGPLHHEAAR